MLNISTFKKRLRVSKEHASRTKKKAPGKRRGREGRGEKVNFGEVLGKKTPYEGRRKSLSGKRLRSTCSKKTTNLYLGARMGRPEGKGH